MNKEKVISFLWQHMLLLFSLWIMTLGIAVCVRSAMGSSVISVLPFVFATAGEESMAPPLTIGQYTIIINAIFVLLQIAILRRQFEPVQLFQLLIGFVFGSLIDLNMMLTSWLVPASIATQAITQLAGCIILGTGIAVEVRCGSITMPGEGLPVALSRVTGIAFPKAKMIIDTTLVTLGVISCYSFFGYWKWNIIGPGTLIAMFFVGMVVAFVSRHLGWFDRLLCYRPGFRRYIYGLARFIYNHKP